MPMLREFTPEEIVAESVGDACCSRCGESHEVLEWRWFTKPLVIEGSKFAAFAMCPTINEPLILRGVRPPPVVNNIVINNGEQRSSSEIASEVRAELLKLKNQPLECSFESPTAMHIARDKLKAALDAQPA